MFSVKVSQGQFGKTRAEVEGDAQTIKRLLDALFFSPNGTHKQAAARPKPPSRPKASSHKAQPKQPAHAPPGAVQPDTPQRSCPYCGRLFVPSRKWEQFCTQSCERLHGDQVKREKQLGLTQDAHATA